ncbi:MAG: hypothetical protein ACRDRP_10485 [Pseudonocardiaceae bacterium]
MADVPEQHKPDMADIRTVLAHLVTPDAAAAGRGPTGRYLALCAAELIPAAREEPGHGYCQPCLSSHQTPSQRPRDTR